MLLNAMARCEPMVTRCGPGGLAVQTEWLAVGGGLILVVSRVTSDFGRPLAVGVYMAESI